VENNQSAVLGTKVEKLINWIGENPWHEFTRWESQILLVKLLSFIHSPHDLRYFFHIVHSLSEMFLEFSERLESEVIDELKEKEIDIKSMEKIVNHVLTNQDEILEYFNEEIETFYGEIYGGMKHPMRRKFKYYYIYAMLMNAHQSEDIEIQQEYRALQGYVFLSHSLLVVSRSNIQFYLLNKPEDDYLGRSTSSGINASKIMRDYSLTGNNPSDLLDLSDFKSLINSMSNIGNLEPKAKRILRSYLELGLGLRGLKLKKGGGGGGYKRLFHGWSDGFIRFGSGQSNEKQDLEDSSLTIISPFQGDDERQKEFFDLDLDPFENQGEEELILIDNKDKKAGRLFTRSQVRHVIMSNQMFRNQWTQATVYELTILMKACGEQVRDENTSDLRLEVIAMVMIMLWTGSNIKSVKSKFRWLSSNRRYGQDILGYKFNEDSNTGEWLISPHTANTKRINTKKEKSYCRVKDDFLELPDPFRIGLYILKAFPDDRLSDTKNRLFNRKLTTYRKELNNFLIEIKHDHRLNEFKISRYLFYKIATEHEGDIADAILITGRYHPLGQTLLHYTSPDKERLQGIYLNAISDVISSIYAEGYICEAPKVAKEKIRSTNVVGSNLCPTIDAVENLVINIQEKIKRKPKEELNSAIIEYHNWYTLYTILFIGYSTGYRAIVDPFPIDSEIDENSGLAVVSDKDGEDYYNSRIVWVPKSVRKQIDHYMQHRDKVLLIVASRHPDLVLNKEEKGIPRIFLLEDGYRINDIRPSTLSPLLKDHLPLPINVNRRFLRTELRARGCPSEIVNAFMGHWSRGQEPWGRYSSLAVVDIVDVLKIYIEDILEELKFKPIKSRFI
jgi:hypothetical protein